ncbi:MAG: hypothetical protein AB1725_11805, partial [Armatimonadota bacterium]
TPTPPDDPPLRLQPVRLSKPDAVLIRIATSRNRVDETVATCDTFSALRLDPRDKRATIRRKGASVSFEDSRVSDDIAHDM